jgi:predicted transcriptional regulator
MAVVLNSQTQKLIEERMKETGVEDLDAETRAAVEEGLAQADRGEGRPWEEVREELRARFIK